MRHALPILAAIAIVLTGCIDDDAGAPSLADDWRLGDTEPVLVVTDDPATAVRVAWLTTDRVPTRLALGTSPDALTAVDLDEATHRLHRVELTDLTPDTTYHYRAGDDATVRTFRTAPAQPRVLRIGIVGDMQPDRPALVDSGQLVADALAGVDVDLWVQVGDIVHDGGELDEWAMLLENLPRFAAETPLVTAVGNHDLWGDDGANWERLFTTPERGRYFSVDVLDAHLVVVDNFDGPTRDAPSQDQLDWLDADLAAARAAGKWIFVFMHTSLISTGTANSDFAQQQVLVPLFHRHAVDGVFYGHDHMYEHFLYTYGGTGLVHDPAHADDPRVAVHYWLTGGGGAELESGYGLTTREPETVTRSWYDLEAAQWIEVPVEIRPWSETRVAAGVDPAFSPHASAYVHDCEVECHQDDAPLYGHEYGENALHYMVVEIEGDTATISAHHPDGSLLDGQQVTLIR